MTEQRLLAVRTALVWLLLELVAAAQVRLPSGELVIGRWLRTTVSPVLFIGQSIGSFVSSTLTEASDSAALTAENDTLRIALERQRAINLLLAEDAAATAEVGPLTELVPQLAPVAIPGRIWYRDLHRGRLVAIVAGGTRILDDASVIAAGGLLGRVIRSEGRRCWVELITHPATAVAVQTVDGGVRGLAVGAESFDLGSLDIQYVPRQAHLLRGDVLVSSGADGVYPPGIPVGVVTTVRESDRPFLDVRAKPAAQPATSRIVLLIDPQMSARAGDGAVP